jgi:hypothetical protein
LRRAFEQGTGTLGASSPESTIHEAWVNSAMRRMNSSAASTTPTVKRPPVPCPEQLGFFACGKERPCGFVQRS